jgi:hypothetical protein
MLFVLSGAGGSGKKTVGRLVAPRVERLVVHNQNDLVPTTRQERMAQLEHWIEHALRYEAEGRDVLLLCQSPLGEVLVSPRAPELEGIAACLLDVHDHERAERLAARNDTRWPFGMDTLCWAAFPRMHAIDPRFEQRVLHEPVVEHYDWSRWQSWRRGDPRWRIEIIDTTAQPIEGTVASVIDWIGRTRERGAPLSRAVGWWRRAASG